MIKTVIDKRRMVGDYSTTIRTIRRLFVDYSSTIHNIFRLFVDYLPTIRTIRRLFALFSFYQLRDKTRVRVVLNDFKHDNNRLTSISNGNRTEWSPIRSVIIRVITKSDDRAAGVRFVYHEYDYRPNWTTRSPITN